MSEHENPDIVRAYKRFAAAIVLTAVEDYKHAFKMYLKCGGDLKKLTAETRKNFKKCPEFFASEWCDVLSEFDGKQMQKHIEECCYKELGQELRNN